MKPSTLIVVAWSALIAFAVGLGVGWLAFSPTLTNNGFSAENAHNTIMQRYTEAQKLLSLAEIQTVLADLKGRLKYRDRADRHNIVFRLAAGK